jgi:glycosyltransferase involved in cell wall biosynthesis
MAGSHAQLHVGFAGEPTPAVTRRLQEASVQWSVLDGWVQGERVRPWAFVGRSLSLLRRVKPDVVAVHFGNELPTVAAIVLSQASGFRGCRWFWHQRQQIKDPSAMARHLSTIRVLSWFCHRLVPLYEGGRESLEKRGIATDKIRVVRNGVRACVSTRPAGRLHEELHIPAGRALITSISSLIPRKRVDLSIRAFSCLLKQRTWENRPALLVAGDGAERERLLQRAHVEGVENDVHFLGMRNDIPDILLESDVTLLTSDAEASPLAILQSMAAGIPSVVTDAGAAREMVVDGRTGFVVDADPVAIAAALADLLTDKSRRRTMGAAARQRWGEQYTLESMVEAHMRLYGVM